MNHVIRDFHSTLEDSTKKLSLMTEAQARTPRAEGKWSPKEIIGHLIDSAANNHPRFITAQFRDDMIFSGYDQEKWVSLQHYNEASWLELIHLWKSYNVHLAHVISAIPESAMKKTFASHNLDEICWQQLNKNEPATLEYLITDYVAHMKHHLRQAIGS